MGRGAGNMSDGLSVYNWADGQNDPDIRNQQKEAGKRIFRRGYSENREARKLNEVARRKGNWKR